MMSLNEQFSIGKWKKMLTVGFVHCLIDCRAAQDRNTEQQAASIPAAVEQSIFQALSPEKSFCCSHAHDAVEFNEPAPMLRPFSTDKTSLKEAFQRIKIAGDFQDMSHIEDLEDAVGPLLRAMVIREKLDRWNSICPLGSRFSHSLLIDTCSSVCNRFRPRRPSF